MQQPFIFVTAVMSSLHSATLFARRVVITCSSRRALATTTTTAGNSILFATRNGVQHILNHSHVGTPSRYLSGPPPKKEVRVLTPDETQLAVAYVEKHNKFMENMATPYPKTFQGGPATDLYVAKDPSEMRVLTGMPIEHQQRTVLIGPRYTTSMQSGDKFAHQWQISWQQAEVWSNPLTGWTSSSDPHATMKLTFSDKDAAIAFATKSGWKYEVLPSQSSTCYTPGEKNYAHNFLSSKNTTLIAQEGHAHGNVEFANPAYGKSHWFMPLTYHGNKEVEQFGPPVAK